MSVHPPTITTGVPFASSGFPSVDGVRTKLVEGQRSHGFLEAFGNTSWGILKHPALTFAVGCVSGP